MDPRAEIIAPALAIAKPLREPTRDYKQDCATLKE